MADQTINTEFSEFNTSHLPKQTRLPEDGESSFSSLDSDIAVAHNQLQQSLTPRQKSNRFRYLELESWQKPRAQSRTIGPSGSVVRTPPSYRPSPAHIAPQCHQRSLDPFQTISNIQREGESRVAQLLLQNENYRLELEVLKASNESIHRQLRQNQEQLKTLRHQVKENGQRYHESYIRQHELVDRNICDKLLLAERQLSKAQSERDAVARKLQSEKTRTAALQKEISHLRERIGGFQRQLYEISVKEDKLKQSYQEAEEEHTRKIAQLERSLQAHQQRPMKGNAGGWQENFIDVLLDMVEKCRERQGMPGFGESLSKKKRAKECWRYLKRAVLRQRNLRQPIAYIGD